MLGLPSLSLPWGVFGVIILRNHAQVSESVSVNYIEEQPFASNGMYAVWQNTSVRDISLTAELMAGNVLESIFNILTIKLAWMWCQGVTIFGMDLPPLCLPVFSPIHLPITFIRPVSYSASVDATTPVINFMPVFISLSMSFKECRPI